jgi:hypothetical protein
VPSLPLPSANAWFTMIVALTIHDSLGNTAQSSHSDVRLFPQGTCGF